MKIKMNRWQAIWRGINLLVVATMLIGLGAGMGNSAQAAVYSSGSPREAQPAPVDPDVYVGLEKTGRADVLLILIEQADLSGAAQIRTKALKGEYVIDQLKSVAERTQGSLKAFLADRAVSYRSYWIQNMLRVTVDLKLLQEISYQPGIKYIEFYHQPYPDVVGRDLGQAYGPEYGPLATAETDQSVAKELAGWKEYGPGSTEAVEWNITRVGAPDVWALGITGEGAVIGDLDTGVQWDHPALVNQYRAQIPGAPSRHDYNWFDGGVTTIPLDYGSHGSHTMGTIVGDDGGSNQIGMAPGADWIACPGIGSPYVGPFECFEFFMAPTKLDGTDPRPDLAPHVISNSWSSAGTDFHGAIQALYAAGIYFSKSAGNEGAACSTVTNPGQWPEVTAAAAFASGDTISSFSSRGPVTIGYDQFVKPDIAAPGSSVRSSVPTNSYTTMSGTSMACPHVTGAVALLISANPDLAGQIDIMQMLLKTTAEPKISSQCAPFVDHPNDVWGWGILDIYAAVQAAQNVSLGQIDGTVYDSVTNDPIPEAQITFTNTDVNWPFNDVADSTGEFEATLLAGNYDLSAEMYGYFPGTVLGVVVQDGLTTTQDIYLDPASIWTVSGEVTESQTGDPLEATLEFVGSPVEVTTDPGTGQYSAEIADGTYWLVVTSPGHSKHIEQITVDQDLTLNFSLTAIENYYMRQEECLPAFNWIDATNGTQLSLGDDANTLVMFPAGKTLSFYGTTYDRVYVGSNGIATFGIGNSKWSGPIPDPATPNNGIYAFSDDLYPGVGNGRVYWSYLEERYFVIEWYQVEHYPSGDPETFEIIMDFETGAIKIQYLDVSNPGAAVSGVENSTGTEATQYAYADPVLIADSTAVMFYPTFGTPPPLAILSGIVTDAQSGDLLENASAFATASSTGNTLSFLTDATGNYSGPICADDYTVWAEKTGYKPSADVFLTIIDGTQNQQDFALELDPIFTWTPEILTATIENEGVYETTMTFGNSNGGVITYSLEISPAVSWLTIDPVEGVIISEASQVLTATFDSTGLTAGVYESVLQVATTDPDFTLVEIPVVLTVTCTAVSDLVIDFSPESPLIGEVVTFNAMANGSLPIIYSWDFGDGTTGLGEVVTHTFTAAGTYTVTLTAENCAGESVVVETTVQIVSDSENIFLPIVRKN